MNIKSLKYNKGVVLTNVNSFEQRNDVVTLGVPSVLAVPIKQFKGYPPKIMVEIGEELKRGSVIAKGRTCTIYSPACGTVIGVEKRPSIYGGSCEHVLIKTNGSEESKTLPELDMEQLTPQIIIKRIFDAGIVNNDGVPLYQKLILKDDEKVKEIIINACTDELYLSTNINLLNSLPVEVISGAIYLANCVKVSAIKFVVTNSMIEKLKPFLDMLNEYDGEFSISISSVPDRYPVGDEREIVKAVTGSEIAGGKTALSYGVAVVDASCCYSAFEAISEGVADTKKLITVVGAGENCNESVNAWITVGTTFEDILTWAVGEAKDKVKMVIAGGPMRGMAVAGLECATTKNIKGIMFLTEKDIVKKNENPCIGCGKCVSACPRNLLPYKIEELTKDEDFIGAKKFGAEYCTRCGACEYACPAKRRLVQRITYASQVIKDKGV